MTLWLEQKERVWVFDVVLQWRQGKMPSPASRPRRHHQPGQHLVQNPSAPNTSILTLIRQYRATSFVSELGHFISQYREGGITRSRSRVSSQAGLHITHVDVWWLLKFSVDNSAVHFSSATETLHIAHAMPQRKSTKKILPEQFDTVIANDIQSNATNSNSKSRGLSGLSILIFPLFYSTYQWLVFQESELDRYVLSSGFQTGLPSRHLEAILNLPEHLRMLSGSLAHMQKELVTRCIQSHGASVQIGAAKPLL